MESYRFLKRNIDGNFKSCIISLTESTTPLIDMLPSYRTMKYKSPIWGYFHVQKE